MRKTILIGAGLLYMTFANGQKEEKKNEGHCLLQDKSMIDFDPALNKKIAKLLQNYDDEYVGYHALYDNIQYGKDAAGNIIARTRFVDIAQKRKKDGNCKLEQYIVIEKYEGGGRYGKPYIGPNLFRADGMENIIEGNGPHGEKLGSLFKPYQPCTCIEKTTNWLTGNSENTSQKETTDANSNDEKSATNKKNNVITTNTNGPKEGPTQEFDSNGKITREGEYKSGEKNGLWKEYDSDGNITSKEYFTAGNKDSSFSYSNKTLRTVARYKSNQKQGKQEEYRSNGKLQKLETYDNGKLQGKYGEYNEDGSVFLEGNYKQGKRQGKWLRENGTGYLTEGNYVDGEQDGEWTVKERKTGKLIKTEKYEMGNLKE